MSRKQPISLPSRMLREVRKVEAEAREATGGDGGTGFTVLRMHRYQPPLRTLVDAHKIGATELQAAEQITQAVFAISVKGRLAAAMLEHISHGRQGDNPWPAKVALAVRNYQTWQNHWSAEWKRTRNPMLDVIWSAVIDERPISVIAQEINRGRARTERGIIWGLRHYAAWANMVTGTQAARWALEAQHVFERGPFATSS